MPSEKSCASAVTGVTAMDCSCRFALPQSVLVRTIKHNATTDTRRSIHSVLLKEENAGLNKPESPYYLQRRPVYAVSMIA